MQKRTDFWMVICLLPIFFFFYSTGYAKSAASVPGQKPIVVNVIKVTAENIPKLVNALGSLSAVQSVDISSETSGRIASINFKSGQQVAKGMPIVQLDNEQAQANYQSAVADYQLARGNYERGVPLLKLGGISKQNLDQLKAKVATTKATVQSMLAALNQKQVVAPFSGVLGAFNYQVGDYVKAGDTLVTLVNSQELHANYNLTDEYLPELHSGQWVQVMSSTYPNKQFFGTVTYISPTVSQVSRMVAVEATIENKNGLLSSGMFVHVQQKLGMIKNTIVIPAAAVGADIKGYYVFRVTNNKASKVYLKVGIQLPNKMQILHGLTVGDVIVVAGQQKLEDGSTVAISGH